MHTIHDLVSEAISDFQQVAILARANLTSDAITVEIALKPHRSPTSLPTGKMGVYAFFLDGQALKVGKVGPKSAARYTSQHYNPVSAPSTLAQSILNSPARVGLSSLDANAVGDWIKQHTDRVNLLLPTPLGTPLLSLLEAFLHARWKPLFEGRIDLG